MKRILFIHRSVGRNLLEDGELYKLINRKEMRFNDYDHNSYELGDGNTKKKLGIAFPGNNTNPENYAEVFSSAGEKTHPEVHSLISGYDVIVIKSCYPNSNISSDDHLNAVKKHYTSIAKYFNQLPDKQLIILTSPPLAPLRTNKAAAQRARKLANWLADKDLGTNVSVFNFFDLLAEPEDSRTPNVLKKPYRRLIPLDSHPNPQASREIAPLLYRAVLEALHE